MFDIGFWELLFIGVIGLLVVGPDRLPALATQAGRFVGRIRLKARRLKAQVQQELETEHLKSLVDQRDEELESMRREVAQAQRTFDHAARSARYSGAAGPQSHPEDMLQSGEDEQEPARGETPSGKDTAGSRDEDASRDRSES